MYMLNNWTIVKVDNQGRTVAMRLRGEVFGHPNYPAGQEVTIAAIRNYRLEDDAFSVITRTGSAYVLGKANPTEVGAWARVFQHLQDRRLPASAHPHTAVTNASDDEIRTVSQVSFRRASA